MLQDEEDSFKHLEHIGHVWDQRFELCGKDAASKMMKMSLKNYWKCLEIHAYMSRAPGNNGLVNHLYEWTSRRPQTLIPIVASSLTNSWISDAEELIKRLQAEASNEATRPP